MSVYLKTKPESIEKTCSFCYKRAIFIVGLDTSLYEGIYYVCGNCEDKAINSMKRVAKKYGFESCEKKTKTKKREREKNEVVVPYFLENWGKTRLANLTKAQLVELCVDRDMPKSGTKGELAFNLIKWKKDGYIWKSKRKTKN